MTEKASGTLGSGITCQPAGMGRTMLKPVNPVAVWGCSSTPFSFKYSWRVPDVAGARGAAGGSAGTAAGSAAIAAAAGSAGIAAAAGSAGEARAAAGVAAGSAAAGVTVTVWVAVTVAVAATGSGATGTPGSADALAPVKPITATEPAATPPTSTRQLRVKLFIARILFALEPWDARPGALCTPWASTAQLLGLTLCTGGSSKTVWNRLGTNL